MKTNLFSSALIVCLALTLMLSACDAGAPPATPTAVETNTLIPTNTPTIVPTATLTPTKTPIPTPTPNLAATQQYESFFSLVEKFSDEGLISSVNGEYYPLDDYSNSLAQSGYYNWATYDVAKPTNFILQAKVKIANATTENASKSGCGLFS